MPGSPLPQHPFQNGPFSKCTVKRPDGKQCNQTPDATIHRQYRCQYGICTHMFLSIESRDRHQADVHGSGW